MSNELTKIFLFLNQIGLKYELKAIPENTFLSGLKINNGVLIIDLEKLIYEGDILHEAGHLACMPSNIREVMDDDLDNNDIHQGGEMMAIAWSYAVCIHLKIDPLFVFHEKGYKGAGKNIVKNFQEERYIGVPLMQWCGMCNNDPNSHLPRFPEMINWICLSRPE